MSKSNLIILIAILILGGAFIYDVFIQEFIQKKEGMDIFCQEQGHNKSTDYIKTYCGYYGEEFKIECDGNRIYSANDINWCVKYDKWGRCNWERAPTYYLYTGNRTC